MGRDIGNKHIQLQRLACKFKPLFLFALVTLFIQTGLFYIFANVWESSRFVKNSKQPVPSSQNGMPESRSQGASAVSFGVPLKYLSDNIPLSFNEKIGSKQINEFDTFNLNETLNYVGCEVDSKDAISAINRAKTIKCKLEIANFSCLLKTGQVYPKRLNNLCTLKGPNSDLYVGCFQDYSDSRLLPNAVYSLKTNNTPEKCQDVCIQSGYLYAGVQYRTECWCGRNEPDLKLKLEEDHCSMPCTGDQTKMCGHYFKMNIYQTGIRTMNPIQTKSHKIARIVFLLTLNGRADRQVKRLIKNLYQERHYFFIHVDKRQEYLFNELSKLQKYPNIKLSHWRMATIWGGASLLQMLLNCMDQLLKMDWEWDYVINLSESDFPIKNVLELTGFLSKHMGKNFLKSHSRDSQKFIHKQGLDRNFYECDNHMWRIGARELPSGIWIDGGSDWISLHREFVSYIVGEQDDLVKGLLQVYKHALLPAESFFHSVIRNSKFCDTFVDNNLHLTNWKRKLGCYCQHKHVVDWCGCSPNNFLEQDFDRIVATRDKPLFFARKFEANIDQTIINKVECWINRESCADNNNTQAFWLNLYHQSDDKATKLERCIYNTFKNIVHQKLLGGYQSFDWNIVSLKAVTLFVNSQPINGILTLFEVQVGESVVELEANIIYKSHFICGPLVNQFGHQLQDLYVTSEWDQKEMVSRNYLNILSPDVQSLFVVHQWATVITHQLQIMLVDPNGVMLGMYNFTPSLTDARVHYLKVNLTELLSPGVWGVRLLFNQYLIGENKFLVYSDDTTEVSRTKNSYHKGSLSWFLYWLPRVNTTQPTSHYHEPASTKTAHQGDTRMEQFYEVKDICWGQLPYNNSKKGLLCQETSWSSLSYDNKSNIR